FISAVQLHRELPGLAAAPRFSEALALALIRDAASAAATVDPRAAVPRGTWVRTGVGAFCVAAALLALGLFAPERMARAFTNFLGGEALAALGERAEDGPP